MTLITGNALERHFATALMMARGQGNEARAETVDTLSTLIVIKFLSDTRGAVGGTRFDIPAEATWRAISSSTDVMESVDRSTGLIEAANPSLDRVLSAPKKEWPRRTSELEENIKLLRVIRHLEQVPLRPDEHESRYALGLAHETMIRVGLASHLMGGFDYVTPRDANAVLVGLASPAPESTVNDPAAGLGSTLTELLRQSERDGSSFALSGQEVDPFSWRLCKRNLLLHGVPSANIILGDTLRQPPIGPDGRLQTFETVVTDPPWSVIGSDVGATLDDPWGRFPEKLPRTRPEFAWVYHALATLRPEGRASLLLSQGALFRGGEEKRARKRLVDLDVIEAIITLPNTRQSTNIPSCAVLLNRTKRSDRHERIIFIDAASEPRNETERAIGTDSFALALALARKFEEHPGRATIVSTRDVEGQDYNLAVTRYVKRERSGAEFDLENALLRIRDFERQRETAERAMDEALRQLRQTKEGGT